MEWNLTSEKLPKENETVLFKNENGDVKIGKLIDGGFDDGNYWYNKSGIKEWCPFDEKVFDTKISDVPKGFIEIGTGKDKFMLNVSRIESVYDGTIFTTTVRYDEQEHYSFSESYDEIKRKIAEAVR